MYRSALRSILSELYRRKQLLLVESIPLQSHKTRELLAKLNEWSLGSVLLVDDELDKNLVMASRNLPRVDIAKALDLNPVIVLQFENVLMTRAAVEKIEVWLS